MLWVRCLGRVFRGGRASFLEKARFRFIEESEVRRSKIKVEG